MKNFIAPGNVITLVVPAPGVKSGDCLVVGAFFGIAAYDAAVGQNVEVHLVGVFELPKAADIAIDQGDPCYWDSLAVTNVGASGNLLIGGCTESVLSSAPTVRVRLNGMTVY